MAYDGDRPTYCQRCQRDTTLVRCSLCNGTGGGSFTQCSYCNYTGYACKAGNGTRHEWWRR